MLFYTLFFLTHEVRSHCAFFSYALKGRKYPMSTGKRGLDKKQGNQVTIMVNHNSFSVKGLVRKTLLLSFVSCIHQILEHEIVENKEPQGFKGFREKILKIQLHWKSKINFIYRMINTFQPSTNVHFCCKFLISSGSTSYMCIYQLFSPLSSPKAKVTSILPHSSHHKNKFVRFVTISRLSCNSSVSWYINCNAFRP